MSEKLTRPCQGPRKRTEEKLQSNIAPGNLYKFPKPVCQCTFCANIGSIFVGTSQEERNEIACRIQKFVAIYGCSDFLGHINPGGNNDP